MKLLKQQRGFSLIEIMVAFVIGASSLGLLYKIQSNAIQAIIVSEEYAIATDLAQSLMAEFSALYSLSNRNLEGNLHNKFYWKVEHSTNTPLLQGQVDNVLGLTEITVSVLWQSKDKERELLFSGIKPLVSSQQLGFSQ